MRTAAPLARPPRLRRGDRVAVVSPCSPMPADRLDAACAVVRGWGLEVVEGAHARDRHPALHYLAGTDADRAADLRDAWLDRGVSAVLCARGGDGAHRTLDALDFTELRRGAPKAFVGYSDVTALHEAFAVEMGVATVHGPVIASAEFLNDARTAEELRATLMEPETRLRLTSDTAEPLVGGAAHGITVGGNLSLLADGIATPHSRPSAAGGIVLLEDIGEDVSRIDRMLTQLLRSGWLRGAAGFALGSWRDCTPGPESIRELMRERLGPLGVPVVWELGFGHGASQLTVPLGVAAVLDADRGELRLHEPALA
ncbi:muramoyltetrapeptide carboxypeptidase [Murinocardiopsis flavida]|uniref:Muramoyltetrapeptide carboxypeptidase n=1 Tax=Murinocardiopsis flavida TaxID=645275 RepID=A0A2P8D001_9ACTN|nr:LD-carboxypeptidase [Murinocardiopsis flavida]PSK90496.1 muramoyltetrapeptide carboxypeptidase [Murinocardiopsis flavida]